MAHALNADDLFPSFQSKDTFMKAIDEILRSTEWSLKLAEGDELGPDRKLLGRTRA